MMKNSKWVSILFIIFLFSTSHVFADVGQRAVKIIKPLHKAVVSNPVEICMEAYGLEVEPAENGVNEGKGHHHLMVDMYAPDNPEMPLPLKKDSQFIHLSDGSACTKMILPTGRHFIRTLFAKGNHIPHHPLISDTIIIYIKK